MFFSKLFHPLFLFICLSLSLHHPLISEGPVIWTKSGAQSYNWEVGRVAIITTATNPKVFLEGTAGDGYQGDIAIDDIILVYGDCPALCEFVNFIPV